MDCTTHHEENPPNSVIPPVVMFREDRQGNINPASLVQKIFNNPEALTMLHRAILSEESGEALKAHHPEVNNAGALKAQETAATLEGPATKRPQRADSLVIEEAGNNAELETNLLVENNESFVDKEDEHAQSASCWQASEDLSSFLDTTIDMNDAKIKELESWRENKVCHGVPHTNKKCVSTSGVYSFETVNNSLVFKARLVAWDFKEYS